ncbi:general stress protein [Leptolyngbya sp. FACHB-261]|uniref:general stress protein n=1 Tax=Leptolyngbya sp. FACHB-261 TaxID=2692806 RepID=UPI001686A4B1|nr:general stress protein [Leptolyngbya sp. FACHB-261]MBD2100666.1 DUF1269 domain-containing protein [Leptolyngbya sp. FACHB-261]
MAINYDNRRAIGIFPTRDKAELAINQLRASGFPMDNLSIVARDTEEGRVGGADVTTTGAAAGASAGTVAGGLAGLLLGIGSLAIPGVGPVITAGALGSALATAAAGAGVGAATGGLLGALAGLGVPESRAQVYHDRIQRGDFLVILEGSKADVVRAETILHDSGIEEFASYDVSDTRFGHVYHDDPDIRVKQD